MKEVVTLASKIVNVCLDMDIDGIVLWMSGYIINYCMQACAVTLGREEVSMFMEVNRKMRKLANFGILFIKPRKAQLFL